MHAANDVIMAQARKRKLNVALFGAGRAGSIHIENILKMRNLHLKYLVEVNVDSATALLQSHCVEGEVEVVPYDQATKVYHDEDVNAVLVCTPTQTHGEIVLAAIKNGKSVFCEKPISDTVEETAQCYELAEKNKCILFCSFNRRFDPTLRALYTQANQHKAIGQLQVVKCCARDNPKPPLEYLRISSGIYHDCAVHDLDLACWFLGEFPVEVTAFGHAWDPEVAQIPDYDTTFIFLRFPSGAMASIDLSRTAIYGYDQRVELLGSSGMLQSDNQRPTSLINYQREGANLDPLKYSFKQRYKESYENCLKHFVDLINGSASPEVTRTSTLNVALLADACDKSAKSGKPVQFNPVL